MEGAADVSAVLESARRDDGPSSDAAPPSARFVDVVDGAPALYDTRLRSTWSEGHLRLSISCQEPAVAPFPGGRGMFDWEGDYVELLIDGADCYYGLAVTPSNAVAETLYVWRDALREGSRFDIPALDLVEQDALVFEGETDRTSSTYFARRSDHPRGLRWAFRSWRLPGLTAAVAVEDDTPPGVNRRWRVDVSLPWSGLRWIADRGDAAPQPGETWRLHAGRHAALPVSGGIVHAFWAWVPLGTTDRHHPERFGVLRLGDGAA